MACVWCEDEELAYQLMNRMVNSEGQLSTEEYQKAIPDLFNCMDCVNEYHRVKTKFTLNKKQILYLHCDEDLRINHFLSNMTAIESSDIFISFPTVQEILCYPYFLLKESLFNSFSNEVNRILVEPKDNIIDEKLFCGVFLMLLNPHKKVHEWARTWIESSKYIDNETFFVHRPILVSILKIYEEDLYLKNHCEVDEVAAICETTMLPKHIYDKITCETLLDAINVIFNCLQARVLTRLLMNEFNKNFFAKLLNQFKRNKLLVTSELVLLQTLLEKLVSSFWLLPGNFDAPLALYKMIVDHPTYIKSSNHYRSKETGHFKGLLDQPLIVSWMLPFVKSIVHFDSKEAIEKVLSFLISIFNTCGSERILFQESANACINILMHICQISRIDLLAKSGKMLSEAILFILNQTNGSSEHKLELRKSCVLLVDMILKHGLNKKIISYENFKKFESNFTDFLNGRNVQGLRDMILFIFNSTVPIKMGSFSEDENADEAYRQLMIMESVNSQLADGTANQPIILTDEESNMQDDDEQEQDSSDNKSSIKLLPLHILGSQSPIIVSDSEDDVFQPEEKHVDFAVEQSLDEEEIIHKIKNRKRKFLFSKSEDENSHDESDKEQSEEKNPLKPLPTQTAKATNITAINVCADKKKDGVVTSGVDKFIKLGSNTDKDTVRYNRTKYLSELAKEQRKKETEKASSSSKSNNSDLPVKTAPVKRKMTTSLRREQLEKDLCYSVKPSTKTLPSIDTKLNYTVGVFLGCILAWKVQYIEEDKDEVTLKTSLKPLPFSFESFDDYMKTFWPLLLLETWAQIRKDWNEKRKQSRGLPFVVDSFEKQNADMNGGYLKCSYYDEGGNAQCPCEDDLLVLKFSDELKMFGLVERSDRVRIASSQNNYRQYTLTVRIKNATIIPFQRCVLIQQISSLTTSIRQWKGMIGFRTSLLAKDLLKPFRERTYNLKEEPIKRTKLLLKLNHSQYRIVSNFSRAVSSEYVIPRICLLQGPPGTGKSYTVKTIICHLLQDLKLSGWNKNNSQHRDRILVCAPSNAAVDEIVKRLINSPPRKVDKESAARESSNCGDFKLIRIGRRSQVDPQVHCHTLEFLLEKTMKKLSINNNKNLLQKQLQQISKALENLDNLCVKMKMGSNTAKKEEYLQKMEERSCLQQKYDTINKQYERVSVTSYDYHEEERKYQLRLLLGADIVCCTLSGAGGRIMTDTFKNYFDRSKPPFKCVIIDEAGQCTEPDALIPLQYGTSKLLLVGDPAQLPATVMSQKASRFNYGQSLFERLSNSLTINNKDSRPAAMLDIQYRMLPAICSFPSAHFYDSHLKCAKVLTSREESLHPLKPYVLLDIDGGREEKSATGSLYNSLEKDHIIEICHAIKKSNYIDVRSVGIITPYRSQKDLLKRELKREGLDVIVRTVDAFQGQECDIIILSSVRANNRYNSIGFLKNPQRMNVALTRAKQSLIIIADCKTLKVDEDWGALVKDAKDRLVYYKVDSTKKTIDAIMTDKWKTAKQKELDEREINKKKQEHRERLDRKKRYNCNTSTGKNSSDDHQCNDLYSKNYPSTANVPKEGEYQVNNTKEGSTKPVNAVNARQSMTGIIKDNKIQNKENVSKHNHKKIHCKENSTQILGEHHGGSVSLLTSGSVKSSSPILQPSNPANKTLQENSRKYRHISNRSLNSKEEHSVSTLPVSQSSAITATTATETPGCHANGISSEMKLNCFKTSDQVSQNSEIITKPPTVSTSVTSNNRSIGVKGDFDVDNVADIFLEATFNEQNKNMRVSASIDAAKIAEIKQRLSDTFLKNKLTSPLIDSEKKSTASSGVVPNEQLIKKHLPKKKKKDQIIAAQMLNLSSQIEDFKRRESLKTAIVSILVDNSDEEEMEEDLSKSTHGNDELGGKKIDFYNVSKNFLDDNDKVGHDDDNVRTNKVNVSTDKVNVITDNRNVNTDKENSQENLCHDILSVNPHKESFPTDAIKVFASTQPTDITSDGYCKTLNNHSNNKDASVGFKPKNNSDEANYTNAGSPSVIENPKRRDTPSESYFKLPHRHSDGTFCEVQCVRLVEREAKRKCPLSRQNSENEERSPMFTAVTNDNGKLEGVSPKFPDAKSNILKMGKVNIAAVTLNTNIVDAVNAAHAQHTHSNSSSNSQTITSQLKLESSTQPRVSASTSKVIVDPRLKNKSSGEVKPVFPDQCKPTGNQLDNMELSSVLDTPITLNEPVYPKTDNRFSNNVAHTTDNQFQYHQSSEPSYNLMRNIMQTNPNWQFSQLTPSTKSRLASPNHMLSQTFSEQVDQLSDMDRNYVHNYAAGFAAAIIERRRNDVMNSLAYSMKSASQVNALSAINMFQSKSDILPTQSELPAELKNLPNEDIIELLKVLITSNKELTTARDITEVQSLSTAQASLAIALPIEKTHVTNTPMEHANKPSDHSMTANIRKELGKLRRRAGTFANTVDRSQLNAEPRLPRQLLTHKRNYIDTLHCSPVSDDNTNGGELPKQRRSRSSKKSRRNKSSGSEDERVYRDNYNYEI